MKNNYILVDFENVQPKNLGLLRGHAFTLIVFVGANQKSVPFDFAKELQDLGENAGYQKITGNGSNALDFHIAFYLGEVAAKDANAYFHVISRDKGFDPLIQHLRQRKISALRHVDLSEIPFVKISNASTPDQKIEAIVDSLRSRGTARPRKIKTLKGTVNALFMKTLDQENLEALVEELKKRGHVTIKEQSVSYGPDIVRH
ncbi:PIN domain-containing protein [Aliiroseovarius subalbicans]|uniref:PIN domain-containing protein n=1 Tax=Aliiroseovarius subalbicans TaxID=2925840 RepID=UPI001F5A6207|nr:PIN domain-containing protein [Aliiroseovarius subalbicans]MCI2399465.1 PIN domain-containing protein [Aliiroseovarius subalbicans]